jgi:hypothetical protein
MKAKPSQEVLWVAVNRYPMGVFVSDPWATPRELDYTLRSRGP